MKENTSVLSNFVQILVKIFTNKLNNVLKVYIITNTTNLISNTICNLEYILLVKLRWGYDKTEETEFYARNNDINVFPGGYKNIWINL